MKNNNVALISSAINPNLKIKVSSPAARAEQTIKAVNSLINKNVFDKIIIIDATGYDLSEKLKYNHGSNKIVSAYSFYQDPKEVNDFGYGFGETRIYDHFLKIYDGTNGNIHKISGRYGIDNIDEILNISNEYDEFYFTYYPRFLQYRKYVHTSFFKCKLENLEKYSEYCRKIIEKNRKAPLEEAMYDSITHYCKKKKWISCPAPKYEGIAGATGRNLSKHNFTYEVLRKLSNLPLMAFSPN